MTDVEQKMYWISHIKLIKNTNIEIAYKTSSSLQKRLDTKIRHK